ncbi:hypothetical protein TNCV_1769171 [Trichonephila clavipes]|nr:hypothetical protein TNCV_1769171 [Trichonephila clavipes]
MSAFSSSAVELSKQEDLIAKIGAKSVTLSVKVFQDKEIVGKFPSKLFPVAYTKPHKRIVGEQRPILLYFD